MIRAYPDGVALRYAIPKQPGMEHFVVTKELTSFHFRADATVLAATTEKYHHSFEHEYVKQQLSAIPNGSHVYLPMLTEIEPDLYAAVAEADLTDWAGMYLTPGGASTMTGDLSPRLDGAGLVKDDTPHQAPWRVIMLGHKPGDLIESNLIENLNPPSKIADTSWIKPGKNGVGSLVERRRKDGQLDQSPIYQLRCGDGLSLPADRLAMVWSI